MPFRAPEGPRRRRTATVAAFAVLKLLTATAALAAFASTTATQSMSVSTATLAAPTSLASSNGACVPMTGPVAVNLSWTATPSTFADGYEILRRDSSTGAYTSIGTVAGQTTTIYTDATVAFSTTYRYVVLATKLSWRSANSNESVITTPTLTCL